MKKLTQYVGMVRAVSVENYAFVGTLVQEKAKEFAEKLGKEDLKASNGWLESFKKKVTILFEIVSVKKRTMWT